MEVHKILSNDFQEVIYQCELEKEMYLKDFSIWKITFIFFLSFLQDIHLLNGVIPD
jgi:hypothetical protein